MHVVVTDRRFPEQDPYTEAVEAVGGTIEYNDFETEAEVIEGCADADIIVTRKAPITETVLEALNDIKLLVAVRTGYDHIDVNSATQHGIPVSNTPGYCSHEVSSHAIALMLAAAHEVTYSDRQIRAAENGWGCRNEINLMYEKTFGIVGLGRIGRAAASKARGLEMDVIAYDPFVPDDIFENQSVEKVSFETLLETSECISIHTPLTERTHHMFGKSEFEMMKQDSVLVNTARGPIIKEDELVKAVKQGDIWGAGLDVFENEPPEDSPILESERIVCSPHHAGRTSESRERSRQLAESEIIRAIKGEDLENIVNPELFNYSR